MTPFLSLYLFTNHGAALQIRGYKQLNNSDNDTSDNDNNDNDLVFSMRLCVLTHLYKLFLLNKVIPKGFLCFDFHLVNHSLNLSPFIC